MRRLLLLALVAVTGCSTAPVADFLDTVAPSRARLEPNEMRLPAPGRLPPPDLGPRDTLPPPTGLAEPLPPPEAAR